MEACDQPLIFEQPSESGRFDVVLQRLQILKCGLAGLFRRSIPEVANPDIGIEAKTPPEVVEEAVETIPIHERMASLRIPEQTSADLENRIRKFLLSKFGLENNDVTDDFIAGIILKSDGDTRMLKRVLLTELSENETMLEKAVSRCAKITMGVELEKEDLVELITTYRSRIVQSVSGGRTIDLVESIRNNEMIVDLVEANGKLSKIAKTRRNEALTGVLQVNEYASVFRDWEDNPCSLSDTEMSEIFQRETTDNRFLTTFFDTAQFGLVNRFLEERASRIDKKNTDFDAFLKSCKTSVIGHFEPFDELATEGERRFVPENCIFTKNGTSAFRFFYDNYLKDDDSVLVTSEEYGEITHMMGGGGKEIQLSALPVYEDKAEYLREIENRLRNSDINYILVSAVSRRGSVFPLEEINEARKRIEAETGRRIHLIVDGCQAVGRRALDFNDFEPDVFIASSQKGTDFGGPVGLLALSSDFISEKGKVEYDETGKKSVCPLKDSNNEEVGTLNKTDMARFALGIAPESLGRLKIRNMKKEITAKMLLSVEERQAANHGLACKFAKLARAMNKKTKGRFKILYPTMIYGPNGTLNEDRLSNIFECKIRGLERKDVIEIAQTFGVTIQDFYDEAEKGVSFRIALHPFMNNNSLKILGYALHECCAMAQKKELSERKAAAA